MLTPGDIANDAADELVARSIPVYGVTKDSRPIVVGSGALLAVGDWTYLATVAHVMRDLAESEVYLPTKAGLSMVAERGFTGGVAETEAEEYLRDIAVLRLSQEIAANLASDVIKTTPDELD